MCFLDAIRRQTAVSSSVDVSLLGSWRNTIAIGKKCKPWLPVLVKTPAAQHNWTELSTMAETPMQTDQTFDSFKMWFFLKWAARGCENTSCPTKLNITFYNGWNSSANWSKSLILLKCYPIILLIRADLHYLKAWNLNFKSFTDTVLYKKCYRTAVRIEKEFSKNLQQETCLWAVNTWKTTDKMPCECDLQKNKTSMRVKVQSSWYYEVKFADNITVWRCLLCTSCGCSFDCNVWLAINVSRRVRLPSALLWRMLGNRHQDIHTVYNM